MKRFIKNKDGSLILLGAIILLISFIALEMLFYPNEEIPEQEKLDTIEEGWLGAITGFFDMVFNGIQTLWETLSFQSSIITQLGIIGIIFGMFIWALMIIGLIDILWIG